MDSDGLLADFEIMYSAEAAEVTKEVERRGVGEMPKLLRQQLDKWKETPLNIAVTGVSGSGKSSFINAIRRLDADSDGAAEVGCVETTMEPTAFAHPSSSNVLFWDLPGVGTPNFPRETYLDKVGFEKYDFFLIICCGRFTENDLWLARQIRERNKRFYFARTQIDKSIDDDKHDRPRSHTEQAVLDRVRKNCNDILEEDGFCNTSVFLISSRLPHRWDFPKLEERFIEDIPDMKKETMLYCIRNNTARIIAEKKKTLFARAWKIALASAAVAAVPLPGLSIAADVGLLIHEIAFYKSVFGLDSHSLDQLSQASGIARRLFDVRLQTYMWLTCTAESVLRLLAPHVAEHIAEEWVKFVPFIGSLIAGPISFLSTKVTLEKIITEMEGCAKEIVSMTFSEVSDV